MREGQPGTGWPQALARHGSGDEGRGNSPGPGQGEGFWDPGGDLHAHPQGEAGSSPPSGDHFDPKVFAQLLQEDKGEDGVRNEPNGSRNEALERDSERRVSTCLASGFPVGAKGAQQPSPGQQHELASTGEAGWACSTSPKQPGPGWQARGCRSSRGGTAAIAVHAGVSSMHEPLCPQTHQCWHHHYVGRISVEARVRSHSPRIRRGMDAAWGR